MTGEPTQYLFIFPKEVSTLLQEKANVKITHYYALYYKKKSLLVIDNNSTNIDKNIQLPLTL